MHGWGGEQRSTAGRRGFERKGGGRRRVVGLEEKGGAGRGKDGKS